MAKKTATATKEQQPDLLSGGNNVSAKDVKTFEAADPAKHPAQAKRAQPIAKREAKPKGNGLSVVQKGDAASTLAVIAEALKDPTFKPENMRLVLDMHKEMIAEAARVEFINKFYLMKQRLPRIGMTGRIEIIEKGKDGQRVAGRDKVQQSTPYATYENLREVCDPILKEYGFSMWDETEPSPDGTRLHVITHLDHNNGHGRRSVFPLPAETSGSKNNVQGWGSSNSYGCRYGMRNLLNLRTKAPEDRDTDGNTQTSGVHRIASGKEDDDFKGGVTIEAEPEKTITPAQRDTLIDAIEACGAGRPKVLKHYSEQIGRKLEKIDDLPASLFNDAMTACDNYKANQQAARKHG